MHPFPLSDTHFLVSCWSEPKSQWGIYLADKFDNLVPLYQDPEYALLEPMVIRPRTRPPVIPDRVDLTQDQATVYLQNVYAGPGLEGVPPGTVKQLRVLSYHFGYRGLAGSDKIGFGGPWDAMRIEGTTPIAEDGSAVFKVPANTPLAIQPLDEEGKAVQLMRSWFTAMPGETLSCIGCHESPAEVSGVSRSTASLRPPAEIQPWYGPPRGFDFAREVQPVLNKHCVGCHDGVKTLPDLRPEELVEQRQTWPIGYPQRLTPEMLSQTQGRMTYTPAYDALIHYIRRVGIEDDVSLLVPGEYHADTSPLIQLLGKNHHGVHLDREDWERLITWIDLNAPCHGTWGEVFPIANDAHRRRMELRAKYGGPTADPEHIPASPDGSSVAATVRRESRPVTQLEPAAVNMLSGDVGRRSELHQTGSRAELSIEAEITIELGHGVSMQLKQIPAGEFAMGSIAGEADEHPLGKVVIQEPFWIGSVEVTNQQYRCFDPAHDSRYYARRLPRPDDRGLTLNDDQQPAVRVSWQQALDFCGWLSEQTGLPFSLPTEAQWEYACRAASTGEFAFGDGDADFSSWANLADLTFSRGVMTPQDVHPKSVSQWSGGVPHLVLEGAKLASRRFQDGYSVTAEVGSLRPNAWGLYDMHGNAAEWTMSRYVDYPYRDADGRNDPDAEDRRVVRGGSFFDPPRRSRSAYRVAYHPWQRVFNVGFRVVCNNPQPDPTSK